MHTILRRTPIAALLSAITLQLVAFPVRAQSRLPVWTLAVEWRVGSIDGPDAFAALGSVTVSPRTGNVFVNEYNQRILAFDSAGRQLRSIGRTGGGPGEFGHLAGTFWADGLLMATDARSHRISWFTEEGEVVESRNVESGPIPSTSQRASPRGLLANDLYLGLLHQQVQRNGLMSSDVKLLRMDGNGNDSVIAEFPDRGSWFPARGVWVPIPWVAGAMYAPHPHGDGVVIVYQGEAEDPEAALFRVRRMAGNGSLRFARSYQYTPLPLPEEYIDDFVNARRAGIERGGLTLREAGRIIREHMPRFQSPIAEVVLGADGTVWLKRQEEAADVVWWWVLDRAGEPVGSLQLPRTLRVRYVQRDRLWAVETDELGVYHLARYRIAR